MKTNKGGAIFHLAKYVLFFFIIILLQSCTSTSYMRLEGSDFKDNLPGRWDGKWQWQAYSGPERIKISKIDGNKVHLTGFQDFGGFAGSSDEVYGRIENSTLILTWPAADSSGCDEEYKMKRDDSNNLILDGYWRCSNANGTVQLKKIVGGSNIDLKGERKAEKIAAVSTVKVNPNEPWTGIWKVEGDQQSEGQWAMKQDGKIVKSTKDSSYEFKGKVKGNQLKGKVIADYGITRSFVINIHSDGQSFEGKIDGMRGTPHIKGKRIE